MFAAFSYGVVSGLRAGLPSVVRWFGRSNKQELVRGAVKVRPSLDVTVTGLVYVAMMMFMGLAAMNTQAAMLFVLFGLMIGVLLASGVISRWVLRHVAIRRIVPADAAVGSTLAIGYELDNRKRFWPTISLTIAEIDAEGAFDRQPHAYVLHAASGETARVAAEVVPMRRGTIELVRYQIATSFPFGFIKRAIIRRQPDTALVRPAQGTVDPIAMTRFISAESTGLNQRPRPGGNDEFYGTRDYRPGDPMRTIHWRRSARTGGSRAPGKVGGTLVVKQMTRVAPPRLLLCVDTFAPPPGPRLPTPEERELRRQRLISVERNLAVAASLLAAATRRGLAVGLIVPEGDGFLEIKPDRSKRGRRDLLAVLAEAKPNDTLKSEALLSRGIASSQSDTSVVFVTAGASVAVTKSVSSKARRVGGTAVNVTKLPSTAGRKSPGRGNVVNVYTNEDDVGAWVQFDDDLDWDAMIPENAASGTAPA